jgi:prolyl oligopeptidase
MAAQSSRLRALLLTASLAFFAAFSIASSAAAQQRNSAEAADSDRTLSRTAPPPPGTQRDAVRDTLHGTVLTDPYRWLEEKQADATRTWIKKQSAYSDSIFASLPGREQIRGRMAELFTVDVTEQPVVRGDQYFFRKREADQDQHVLYVRSGPDGEDRVLVDPHEMDPEHKTSVQLMEVSEDGSLLAYGVREGGEDEVTPRFLDMKTGEPAGTVFPKDRYSGMEITPDNEAVYYTRVVEGEGPRVFRHEFGTPVENDEVVFGSEYGPDKIISQFLTPDGRYLGLIVLHGAGGTSQTELHYKDLEQGGPVRTIVEDIEARFFPDFGGGDLFLRTNWKAPNGRILKVSMDDPSRENWTEVVPESEAVIENMALAGGKLFVNRLRDVKSEVVIYGPDGARQGEISFPTVGSVSEVSGRWDSNEAFFSFTSFHVPTTIYRYDVSSGTRAPWSEIDAPVDTEALTVDQVWYTSKDGTRVPMFLLHRKDVEPNGNRPVLLHGYGGFSLSVTPQFSEAGVYWAEQGGVFAVANIRGGGEFGEAWHQAGMKGKKQNVFNDFLSAAEWLFESDWTRPEKLAIIGGSNGGLLVGAALTQRPSYFSAVLCAYPVLDMIRYHKFLVAQYWVPEYGSAEKEEQFRYLLEYSPYHNVAEDVAYPATLFVTGDSDTRVAPLHARKMTARLQRKTGSDRPVMLKYDTETGHSGGMPISKQIEDTTNGVLFLLWQLGEL